MSGAADSAAEPTFMTTKEVAALLRVKERKVYDLAAAGEIPFRRVTGKLLFPKAEIEAWLEGGRDDARVAAASVSIATPRRPNVMVGSHDPLLDWALRESRSGLASLFDGSLDGLERLAAGEAAAGGLHVLEKDGASWNIETVSARLTDDQFVMIEWAKRRRGLLTRNDHDDAPRSISDLRGRRMAARQPSAGASAILQRLLAQAGVPDEAVTFCAQIAHTEWEAAEAVVSGEAEVALGLEAMAKRLGLGFQPLLEERFDLVIERRAYFEPPLQALLTFAHTADFRAKAASLGGYDVSEVGRVVWNGV